MLGHRINYANRIIFRHENVIQTHPFPRRFSNNAQDNANDDWKILRMDDHGHTAILKSGFKSKDEADKYLKELTERNRTPWGEGHKQVYWIENNK